MNISAEEKNRYLREAEVVLAREGFLTDRIRTGGLRVLLDGLPLCEVPESGGVTYRMADVSTPERVAAKDTILRTRRSDDSITASLLIYKENRYIYCEKERIAKPQTSLPAVT